MKINKIIIIDNIKTIFYALVIALIVRSFIIQPFYIPSSSMEPNLLIGDRLFVTKYSYGYSKHSFPFSPPIIKNRIFSSIPNIGDVIVFKTPTDNRTDYIKRLIGLPGDVIQFNAVAYDKKGKGISDAILNARLVRILREGDYNYDTGEVNLWNPTF